MSITVVVIDDKPLILQSIVQTVDWDRLGCTVVGQAEDGLEGRRVIDAEKPDILITDIKMPGLSGLELALHMQERYPSSKTILITGYQDFDYAQQAVRTGVFDYIVKPIRNEELERIVERAIRELAHTRSETSRSELLAEALHQLEEKHLSTLPSLRSSLITQYIDGSQAGGSAADELAQQYGIACSRCAVVIVRTKAASGAAGGAASDGPAAAELHDRLGVPAGALSAKRDFRAIQSLHRGDLVFACLFPKPLSARELRMKLQAFCHDLVELARRELGVQACIAASSAHVRLPELRNAFAEASAIMASSYFRADEPVLFPQRVPAAAEPGAFSIIGSLEQFNRLLEETGGDALPERLVPLLEQIAAYSEGDIVVAKGLLSDVCLAAARYYYRKTGDEFGLHKSVSRLLNDIDRLPDIRTASAYLVDFVGRVKARLETDDREYSLIVKNVVDYINGHFSDNLSLTGMAEQVGLSPSYLSRLLRSETGINFVDLVAKARIEAAKRLLQDHRYKVNEVGELVGFREYAYFYQVFKKLEGVSPKAYKNRRSGS